jgi:hypothetical protein
MWLTVAAWLTVWLMAATDWLTVPAARSLSRTEREKEKGAAVAGGSKVNREASNRVDRSHSMSRSWTIPVMKEKA